MREAICANCKHMVRSSPDNVYRCSYFWKASADLVTGQNRNYLLPRCYTMRKGKHKLTWKFPFVKWVPGDCGITGSKFDPIEQKN